MSEELSYEVNYSIEQIKLFEIAYFRMGSEKGKTEIFKVFLSLTKIDEKSIQFTNKRYYMDRSILETKRLFSQGQQDIMLTKALLNINLTIGEGLYNCGSF